MKRFFSFIDRSKIYSCRFCLRNIFLLFESRFCFTFIFCYIILEENCNCFCLTGIINKRKGIVGTLSTLWSRIVFFFSFFINMCFLPHSFAIYQRLFFLNLLRILFLHKQLSNIYVKFK